MTISAAAEVEAEHLGYWCHIYGPVDNAEIAEQLAEGLAEAKAAYLAARFVHDHAAAEVALAEVRDLTALCAAMADGLALQQRWLASDPPRPWPLGA